MPQSTTTPFLTDCTLVLSRLQSAVRKVIASSPAPVERATDLQNALNIRAPLAWQVFRLARAEDPLSAVPHIPLADAMTKVLDAGRRRKFRVAALDDAAACYREFEEFVSRHAGDRATFDAMISGLSEGASEQIDLKARRAAFRTSAQLWGLQAHTTYRCLISGVERPDTEPVSVIVQGSRRVRALRPNLALPICRRTVTVTRADDPTEVAPPTAGAELLEEFCSPDLPAVTSKIRGSVAHDFLTFAGVGLTAELDVFLATRIGYALEATEPEVGVTSMIRVPCEQFIADLLVPAGEMDPTTVSVRACGCLEDVAAAETASDEYLLPGEHRAEYLGRSVDALHDESLPRCPELIRLMLRNIGHSRTTFDVFRCRVRYPMLHTCIGLRVLRK